MRKVNLMNQKSTEEKASSLEPESHRVLLMLAYRDFRNDKYQEAKSKLDRADAISPVPMVDGMRAYMASFSEDPQASEYIKKAMAFPGTQAMGLFGSAILSAKKSEFREAERLLSIAISHSPDSSILPLFYSTRAEVRIEIEAFRTALKDIEKALELKPKDEDLHASKGNVLVKMKRYSEALKETNIALEIKSDCASAHSVLGQIDFEQKRAGLGLSHFEKALAINPKLGEAYYFIGLIRIKSEDETGAAELFEKAAELGFTKAEETLPDQNSAKNILTNECRLACERRRLPKNVTITPEVKYEIAKEIGIENVGELNDFKSGQSAYQLVSKMMAELKYRKKRTIDS